MKPAYLMGKFFKTCADHFKGEAAHHTTMAKGWAEEMEQHGSHNARADACSTMAETCASLADKCTKAQSLADLEKLFSEDGDRMVPDEVFGVVPDAPVAKGRPVIRFGQPAIAVEKVDKEFRKLVSIEDGTESESA